MNCPIKIIRGITFELEIKIVVTNKWFCKRKSSREEVKRQETFLSLWKMYD